MPVDAAKREAFDKFLNTTIAHPFLQEALESVLHALRLPGSTGVVTVFGPSGVGKSTLIKHVKRRILRDHAEAMAANPGIIPVALVEAVAPTTGVFDWKRFYVQALEELNEPLILLKAHPSTPPSCRGREATTWALEVALERALKNRKVVALLIDEAQHLETASGAKRTGTNLDALKSMSNLTDTVLVFVGTYQLLTFVEVNEQLTRRSLFIHFRRYRAEVESERQAFYDTLYSLQQRLPLPTVPDLVQDWDYYYTRSLGCIGILKTWLARALAQALEEDRPTLTKALLERHALKGGQCERLLGAILEHERRAEALESDRNSTLRTQLGLPDGRSQNSGKELSTAPMFSCKKPFQRKPTRDAIGEQVHTQ